MTKRGSMTDPTDLMTPEGSRAGRSNKPMNKKIDRIGFFPGLNPTIIRMQITIRGLIYSLDSIFWI